MSRNGFTVLEVLLVVAALAVVAGLMFGMMSVVESTRIGATETKIHGIGLEVQKVLMKKGAAPATLQELRSWEGTFVDSWDRPFEYRPDGKEFKLWSCGPDGKSGTGDDIQYRMK